MTYLNVVNGRELGNRRLRSFHFSGYLSIWPVVVSTTLEVYGICVGPCT